VTFRSKVDAWFVALPILIALRLLWPVPGHLRAGGQIPWTNLIMPVVLLLFFYLLTRSIRYEITDDALIVHQPLFKCVIPLATIYKLRASRSLLSAPALSLDRIEILASKGPYVVISPRDKTGFVRAIQQRVPNVQLEGLTLLGP
jgi:hypothetical protein